MYDSPNNDNQLLQNDGIHLEFQNIEFKVEGVRKGKERCDQWMK